eukprot:365948-Chlamydomonas_euryale.AAC.1
MASARRAPPPARQRRGSAARPRACPSRRAPPRCAPTSQSHSAQPRGSVACVCVCVGVRGVRGRGGGKEDACA